ncbi:hypothetical protein HYH02_015446 [Chlamydomonas schloesseri]|uniref:Polycystin cation channel PKD1/PKD2 domain-containing protein n=1 Tax=Chlamydomonas schloesseri TaxID=2026947 RepID=A0A835VQS0_9CHLO|nr:hypothetical protein HYH02_015446 [Chlamydomonas schloesseri]|eukprot:KAG2422398.1 hypothetical protein HYH02_015446 [Chlamydomonas schloesseri]
MHPSHSQLYRGSFRGAAMADRKHGRPNSRSSKVGGALSSTTAQEGSLGGVSFRNNVLRLCYEAVICGLMAAAVGVFFTYAIHLSSKDSFTAGGNVYDADAFTPARYFLIKRQDTQQAPAATPGAAAFVGTNTTANTTANTTPGGAAPAPGEAGRWRLPADTAPWEALGAEFGRVYNMHQAVVLYSFLQALVLALLLLRLLHALSFQPRLAVISRTLSCALPDLVHLFAVATVVVIMMAMALVLTSGGSRTEHLASGSAAIAWMYQLVLLADDQGVFKALLSSASILPSCDRVVTGMANVLSCLVFTTIIGRFMLALILGPFQELKCAASGQPCVPHDLARISRWWLQHRLRHAPKNKALVHRIDRWLSGQQQRQPSAHKSLPAAADGSGSSHHSDDWAAPLLLPFEKLRRRLGRHGAGNQIDGDARGNGSSFSTFSSSQPDLADGSYFTVLARVGVADGGDTCPLQASEVPVRPSHLMLSSRRPSPLVLEGGGARSAAEATSPPGAMAAAVAAVKLRSRTCGTLNMMGVKGGGDGAAIDVNDVSLALRAVSRKRMWATVSHGLGDAAAVAATAAGLRRTYSQHNSGAFASASRGTAATGAALPSRRPKSQRHLGAEGAGADDGVTGGGGGGSSTASPLRRLNFISSVFAGQASGGSKSPAGPGQQQRQAPSSAAWQPRSSGLRYLLQEQQQQPVASPSGDGNTAISPSAAVEQGTPTRNGYSSGLPSCHNLTAVASIATAAGGDGRDTADGGGRADDHPPTLLQFLAAMGEEGLGTRGRGVTTAAGAVRPVTLSSLLAPPSAPAIGNGPCEERQVVPAAARRVHELMSENIPGRSATRSFTAAAAAAASQQVLGEAVSSPGQLASAGGMRRPASAGANTARRPLSPQPAMLSGARLRAAPKAQEATPATATPASALTPAVRRPVRVSESPSMAGILMRDTTAAWAKGDAIVAPQQSADLQQRPTTSGLVAGVDNQASSPLSPSPAAARDSDAARMAVGGGGGAACSPPAADDAARADAADAAAAAGGATTAAVAAEAAALLADMVLYNLALRFGDGGAKGGAAALMQQPAKPASTAVASSQRHTSTRSAQWPRTEVGAASQQQHQQASKQQASEPEVQSAPLNKAAAGLLPGRSTRSSMALLRSAGLRSALVAPAGAAHEEAPAAAASSSLAPASPHAPPHSRPAAYRARRASYAGAFGVDSEFVESPRLGLAPAAEGGGSDGDHPGGGGRGAGIGASRFKRHSTVVGGLTTNSGSKSPAAVYFGGKNRRTSAPYPAGGASTRYALLRGALDNPWLGSSSTDAGGALCMSPLGQSSQLRASQQQAAGPESARAAAAEPMVAWDTGAPTTGGDIEGQLRREQHEQRPRSRPAVARVALVPGTAGGDDGPGILQQSRRALRNFVELLSPPIAAVTAAGGIRGGGGAASGVARVAVPPAAGDTAAAGDGSSTAAARAQQQQQQQQPVTSYRRASSSIFQQQVSSAVTASLADAHQGMASPLLGLPPTSRTASPQPAAGLQQLSGDGAGGGGSMPRASSTSALGYSTGTPPSPPPAVIPLARFASPSRITVPAVVLTPSSAEQRAPSPPFTLADQHLGEQKRRMLLQHDQQQTRQGPATAVAVGSPATTAGHALRRIAPPPARRSSLTFVPSFALSKDGTDWRLYVNAAGGVGGSRGQGHQFLEDLDEVEEVTLDATAAVPSTHGGGGSRGTAAAGPTAAAAATAAATALASSPPWVSPTAGGNVGNCWSGPRPTSPLLVVASSPGAPDAGDGGRQAASSAVGAFMRSNGDGSGGGGLPSSSAGAGPVAEALEVTFQDEAAKDLEDRGDKEGSEEVVRNATLGTPAAGTGVLAWGRLQQQAQPPLWQEQLQEPCPAAACRDGASVYECHTRAVLLLVTALRALVSELQEAERQVQSWASVLEKLHLRLLQQRGGSSGRSRSDCTRASGPLAPATLRSAGTADAAAAAAAAAPAAGQVIGPG